MMLQSLGTEMDVLKVHSVPQVLSHVEKKKEENGWGKERKKGSLKK